MNYIESEVSKHCDEHAILNIHMNWSKIVGIETNTNIINEHNKFVGKIILLFNGPSKLYLNMIVEFNQNKIKWQNSKLINEKRLVLVDPYWVKAYAPNPKLNVPTRVYKPQIDQFVIEMSNLTYTQFQKRKLFEYYENLQYKFVAAYDNFQYMMKNNQYWHCINSTIKIYGIPQVALLKLISAIDNEKKRIKKEWNKHLQNHFQENESQKLLNELYKRNVIEKRENNVVSFKK